MANDDSIAIVNKVTVFVAVRYDSKILLYADGLNALDQLRQVPEVFSGVMRMWVQPFNRQVKNADFRFVVYSKHGILLC